MMALQGVLHLLYGAGFTGAYSGQSVQSFRLKPSSDSGRNRPAVPGQTVQSSGL
jgi:hypothetical protein